MLVNGKGMVQVYTGNGKGKSTAAIGQAVRALGTGLKTFYAMFMKDYPYNEINAFSWVPEFVNLKQYGNDKFIEEKTYPSEELKVEVRKGLADCIDAMNNPEYNIIVMDEVIVSIYFKLLTVDEVLEVINAKPERIELILTGRYCPQEIIDRADLVTEMKEIKHYYQNGIKARNGIEC